MLTCKREKNKQLARIPCVNHTDHANLARLDTMRKAHGSCSTSGLESLELNRIDSNHYRWSAEVTEGGSLLLHRPGTSALHKGPDGFCRNVEGRDKLILAKSTAWTHYRKRIKGVREAIGRALLKMKNRNRLQSKESRSRIQIS